ncbi:MAG TPA: hypothetical protein VGY57_05300, partial [Vicinamibacterales bacterium]|nr:hypothetical protein [Vicinamibacterales bacterium]
MNRRNFSACMVMAAALAAGIDSARADGTLGLSSTPIGIEGRTNANVSIDARRDLVAVTWAATKAGVTDIFTAVSRDGGRTFGRPARVNDAAGAANVSGEQPPRIAIVEHDGPPWFDVMWTAKSSGGTRLLSSRSIDGGASFGRASVMPGTDAKGNRGWESLAAAVPGRVFSIWLDHRELAEQSGTAPMHHD